MDPAHIDAYVTPYYDSKGPQVRVGEYDPGLASHDEREFLATIAKMKQRWQQLSFLQVYVGAIRLYDLGYRNEAVYWFYTAQYRGRQFGLFLDPKNVGSIGNPGFELRAANGAFFQTAGSWINGYAFNDPDALVKVVGRVQREGRRQVPNLQAIYPNVRFIDKSRWLAANAGLADGMDSLVTYLRQNKDAIKQQRIDSGTEAKYAPLTSKDVPNP